MPQAGAQATPLKALAGAAMGLVARETVISQLPLRWIRSGSVLALFTIRIMVEWECWAEFATAPRAPP